MMKATEPEAQERNPALAYNPDATAAPLADAISSRGQCAAESITRGLMRQQKCVAVSRHATHLLVRGLQ